VISAADILRGRILIVDDLAANVSLLTKMLSGAGYVNVDSTMDPRKVCGLHRQNHYDLILLDLLMPGMDGFAVLDALKAIEAESYVPVLVITAQPGHKLRALQAGAKDFISKPIDLVEAKARIHNMLEVRLLYRQIEKYNAVLEQTVKERTAELRVSEERFHRLTELSSDWYWEQDANGLFTESSGRALAVLGIRGDGSSMVNSAEVDGPRWHEPGRTSLDENIAARRPFLDLICGRTNVDGTEQYFQVSGEPIFSQSGRYTGYRGIGMEVTDRLREH
jgi:PAS domain S-box-containing protein